LRPLDDFRLRHQQLALEMDVARREHDVHA
jgi:hypothetical protein